VMRTRLPPLEVLSDPSSPHFTTMAQKMIRRIPVDVGREIKTIF
jgi:hypothetical protein